MKKRPSVIRGFQAASLSMLISIALFSSLKVDALEKSGWMTMASEVVGDDTSCGAGLVKHELIIRNLNTNALATPSSALFRVYGSSKNLMDQASGSDVSTVGPVCFNPDTDYLMVDVSGDDSYNSFKAAYAWEDPAIVPRGKFMRTTVWLRPKSDPGFDYAHTDPSAVYLNVSPTYKVVLNDFPSTYGATGSSQAFLVVVDWMKTEVAVAKWITGASVSGGAGTKILPAQTLPDGLYSWAYYLSLNGFNNLGGSFATPNVLDSQASGYNAPFLLDTAAPQFVGVSHSPVNPSASDTVTITANATDSLSGITKIEIYLDGTSVKSCSFFYSSSASCVAPTGPFLSGSTHSYYAVATDGAKNVVTSPTQTFTVGVTGVCGSANGVPTLSAPTPTPAGSPNNLCNSGVSSGVSGTGPWTWTCEGPDGASSSFYDAACSAPLEMTDSFKLCLSSCNSGSANFNGGNITLGPGEFRNLRFCRNTSSACDTATGDLTNDSNTTFSATNTPADAVSLTATKGQVQANAVGGVSEAVNVTYNGAASASVTFSVPNTCVPTATCADIAATRCEGKTFEVESGCGSLNCVGTRPCDANWKEVAPGG